MHALNSKKLSLLIYMKDVNTIDHFEFIKISSNHFHILSYLCNLDLLPSF